MTHAEAHLQQICVRYMRLHYPEQYPYVNHSPNEGKRTQAQGAVLVGMGMRKGWPDLEIAWPAEGSHGLYVEFKTKTGRLSAEQAVVLDNLKSKGYRVEVIRSVEAFMALCIEYFGPADAWDLAQLRAYLNDK